MKSETTQNNNGKSENIKKTQKNTIARENLIAKRARKKRLKRKFRLGDNEKEIIKLIGLGVLAVSSLALPGLPMALKPFMKSRGENGFKELLEKLSQKKIVDLGGEEVKLTARGRKLLREIELVEIKISKPDKWDGVWHLISYDIPNTQNKDRDHFRSVLKRWDFYQIQASLWVYPYECKEEVAVIAEYLKISDYVVMMNTDYLPNEDRVENLFDL